MSIPSAILLVLSCSLDNLAVGLVYGARRVSVPFTSNLLIALITSVGTLLFMATGKAVAGFLPSNVAHLAGSLALMLTGSWIIVQDGFSRMGQSGGCRAAADPAETPLSGGEMPGARLTVSSLAVVLENPFIGEVASCGRLNMREGYVLGLALSLNNVANGFAAGVAGSHLGLMAVALMLSSLVTVWAGLAIGRRCVAGPLKDVSSLVTGLIILGIGIYELMW